MFSPLQKQEPGFLIHADTDTKFSTFQEHRYTSTHCAVHVSSALRLRCNERTSAQGLLAMTLKE